MRLVVLAAALFTVPAFAEEKYVKVPYARAVDEVVFAGVKSGKIKTDTDRVRVKDGKVEAAYGTPGSNKIMWKEIKDDENVVVTYMVFLGRAQYDSDGFYMMEESVYSTIKANLIHKHQGRLELFQKKSVENPDRKNPDDWESFIWDADDKCWRWPTTLARVPKDRTLSRGTKLWDHKVLPTLKTGVIEDILKADAKRK